MHDEPRGCRWQLCLRWLLAPLSLVWCGSRSELHIPFVLFTVVMLAIWTTGQITAQAGAILAKIVPFR